MSPVTQSTTTRGEYAERIRAAWRTSFAAVIDAGLVFIQAKAALPHGEFEKMCSVDLEVSPQTARKYMAVAADPRLINRAPVRDLPGAWSVLYELTKLDDDTFEAAIDGGEIRADMSRQDAKRIRKRAEHAVERAADPGDTCRVADLEALVRAGRKFKCVLADPPWPFETWSDAGKDRSPETHYKTMTLDDIRGLPVAELLADDAVVFMWVVDWIRPSDSESVLEAWGVEYRGKAFAWTKTNPSGEGLHSGSGFWTRGNTEDCWLGAKGSPARHDSGVEKALISPVMEHSRKPDEIHRRIERLVAGPRLELFARRPMAGWAVWGNEIKVDEMEGMP